MFLGRILIVIINFRIEPIWYHYVFGCECLPLVVFALCWFSMDSGNRHGQPADYWAHVGHSRAGLPSLYSAVTTIISYNAVYMRSPERANGLPTQTWGGIRLHTAGPPFCPASWELKGAPPTANHGVTPLRAITWLKGKKKGFFWGLFNEARGMCGSGS